MGFFDGFPFTNTHTLNLDWILGEVKKIPAKVDEAVRIAVAPVASALDLHVKDVSNPHNVTLEQVGGAPAGYGLGVTTPRHISSVEELDFITDSGWYSLLCDSGLYIAPGYFFAYGWMRVDSYGEGVCAQTLRTISSESILMRQYISTVGWSEWEWVNPPMALDVEYRTTERRNGKAVYTKLVSLGTLPNSSEKNVVYAPVGDARPFRIEAYTNSSWVIPFNDDRGSVSASANLSHIRIKTTGDYSTVTATAAVWYTKE